MEKHIIFTFLTAVFLCCGQTRLPVVGQAYAQNRSGNISKHKKDLETIQLQIEERRRELEKYKEQEGALRSAVDSLQAKDSQDRKKQDKLKMQMREAQENRIDSEEKYKALNSAYEQWVSILADETQAYIWNKELEFPYYSSDELFAMFFIKAELGRKYYLLDKIKGESRDVSKSVQQWKETGRALKSKTTQIETQRSVRKTAWNEKLLALNETRQKYRQILKEVDELKNSALGLSRMVKKLESQSAYRSADSRKEMLLPRNSLPWPAEGRIVSGFGREEVPELKTWLVREGIRIETAKSSPVRCVLGGKVIFSGPFKSYGNVVIIDHKEGFFTVYGLLDAIAVKKGEWIEALSPIGTAGMDTQEVSGRKPDRRVQGSTLYFEIRTGADAVDPMLWLVKK